MLASGQGESRSHRAESGASKMDNASLTDLLQNIGDRKFWIKPWGDPDIAPTEGQQVFDEEMLPMGFAVRPTGVNVGDILIVYRIKISKIMFIAEAMSELVRVREEGRWQWSIDGRNLTPTLGTHWNNYSLNPFRLRDEYNGLDSQHKVTLGSLQFGGDKRHIPEAFAKFIINKILELEDTSSTYGSNWSDEEIRQTVESYFQMLANELENKTYIKTEFRDDLLTRINRTKGAIEYKYQNISAALVSKGLPYVEGYKPARNYQRALDDAIDSFLEAHPSFPQLVVQTIEDTIVNRPVDNFTNVLEDPPMLAVKKDEDERKRSYKARKYDFSKRESEKLGKSGEEWVVRYERLRLIEVERPDLAEKVERISETSGDGAGYDVLSFEEDGTERFIEVKTTNSGKESPFLITANELDFSEDYSEKYYLYRVFNFKKSPKLFMLKGCLKDRYKITPTAFRVSFSQLA
jgi:hypothetical protein